MLKMTHARIEAFPEYLEPIAAPKNNPVPIIDEIDKDNIVQNPRTLLSSAIALKLGLYI